MPETEKIRKAREAINGRIADTRSSDMSRIMDASRSSQKKGDEIKKEKKKREGGEKEAATGDSSSLS
ncbi:hypothetical protein ACEPPN_008336 [Leptodophora sp. 'Broadleaf-Isolate-01']